MLFRTISNLESQLEAVDVANGEYEAFDALGTRLNLIVDEQGWSRAIPAESDPEAARALIAEWYAENPRFKPDMILTQLVAELQALYRYR